MRAATGEKLVIINADDFGFSRAISDGIIRAHREGIVTSTTIAANMPFAAEAAAMLSKAPYLGAGVHLNLSQGQPLSPEGLALADGDGVMRRTAGEFIQDCCLRPRILRAAEAECDAQIRWVLDHGIHPTHLDSHRHAHGFPLFFRRVAALARRYHIRFVRWYGEWTAGSSWPPAPLSQLATSGILSMLGWVNAMFGNDLRATGGTLGIAHTGYIDRNWLMRAAESIGPGVTEIMTHPGLKDDDAGASQTRLLASRQIELEALCDADVKEAFRRNGIRLVHYGQLP